MKISTSLLLAAIAVTAATAYDAKNLRTPATIDVDETDDDMNVAALKTKKGIQKAEDGDSGGALDEDTPVMDFTEVVGKTNVGKEITVLDLISGKNLSSLDKLLDTISEDTSSSAKKDLSWLDDEETAEQTVIKGDSKPKKSSSTGEWEDSIARKPSTKKESDDMYEDYQMVKAVDSETIVKDDDEDSYAVKGNPKEITKDDDEDDIFTKGDGKRKSWDIDDDEDTHPSKTSTKNKLFPFDGMDDNDAFKVKPQPLIYPSKDKTNDLNASKDKTDDIFASKDKTDDIYASKDKTDYSLGLKDRMDDIVASKAKTDDTFALKGKQPFNETDDDDDNDGDDDTDTLMENNSKKGKRDTYDDDDDDDEVIAVKEDKTTKFPKNKSSEEVEYESEDDVSQTEQTSFDDEETASKITFEV
ncbi:hypothetical protein PsorP6_000858 [Peronosclerospora sorghi]|uniref:Uncharacterized protein n=1 Tax=Peronosclerospora sorghi TaxID=230839 RepID=A0ACC0WXS1_9STRA|nr:hypothetical protein PsorP6_000858 [Peronosclerospora sorghi]